VARRQPVHRRERPGGRLIEAPGRVRRHARREAADIRPGPRRRVLRRPGGAQGRACGARRGLPFLGDYWCDRQQRPVPDEGQPVNILKKALPRRTFLRGVGAALALPLLDAMVPTMIALAATPAAPVRRLGFVFIPMGCDISRWTPPGKDDLDKLSPIL